MEQLAHLFGLKDPQSIHDWMARHKEFHLAVKDGIDEWRVKAVESSLIQRALGYEYEEVSTETVHLKGRGPAGVFVGVPAMKVRKTIKHIAPSDVAIIFYLKNRKQDRWKDVREFEGRFSKREISLRLQAELKTDQLKELGVNELEQLETILSKITVETGEGAKSVYGSAGSG